MKSEGIVKVLKPFELNEDVPDELLQPYNLYFKTEHQKSCPPRTNYFESDEVAIKYFRRECNRHGWKLREISSGGRIIYSEEKERKKICLKCGEEFKPHHNAQKLCPFCRIKEELERERICRICGEPLPKRKKSFCSKCGKEQEKEMKRLWRLHRKQKLKPIKPTLIKPVKFCRICHKSLPKGKHSLCSEECKKERDREKKRLWKLLHPIPPKFCRVCNKLLPIGRKTLCSEECRKIGKRENSRLFRERKGKERLREKILLHLKNKTLKDFLIELGLTQYLPELERLEREDSIGNIKN